MELGANHIGENKLLLDICQPTHGLITNIGKDHMGEFGGFEGIVEAYAEITDYFNAHKNCPFFLNKDDEEILKLFQQDSSHSYSTQKNIDARFYASISNNQMLAETTIHDNLTNKTQLIRSQLFGAYNVYNILSAWAIGKYFKLEEDLIVEAIENYIPNNKRSQIIRWKNNTIIMDAYNANPTSMQLALKNFGNLEVQNKCIIFGDMHELGVYSQKEHENIVSLVDTFNFQQVLFVGKHFSAVCSNSRYQCFANVEDLRNWLWEQDFTDMHFLVKGSRSEKLELAFEKPE
jgi:UDP-N-acetylmuramoyl-tripeptide--D-alanyl-D-alanine ligase